MQNIMVDIVVENEVERLQELRFADCPTRWKGVGDLSNEAFVFLKEWRREAKNMACNRKCFISIVVLHGGCVTGKEYQ